MEDQKRELVERLEKLRDSGFLTDREFAQQRRLVETELPAQENEADRSGQPKPNRSWILISALAASAIGLAVRVIYNQRKLAVTNSVAVK